MDRDATQQHRDRLNAYIARPFSYPTDRFAGRGIVVCAGGMRYFTNAYVAARVLQMLGCKLPIQFWHLGSAEMTEEMKCIAKSIGVQTVDALKVRQQYPARRLNGWELKAYAMLHCEFQEVLLLDADNVAVRNPEYLFETHPFVELGAMFWPDFGRLGADRSIWSAMDMSYRDEPEVESGQIVVDKGRCWKALNVAMFLNEWSDYYYRLFHGDKETFHLGWRKLEMDYFMPDTPVRSLAGRVMLQHDPWGKPIFQHRHMCKWSLSERNTQIPGFEHEQACMNFLDELRATWSASPKLKASDAEQQLASAVRKQRHYLYVRVGYDWRPMELLDENCIGRGSAGMERTWLIGTHEGELALQIWKDGEMTCQLLQGEHGVFSGKWLKFEKMPVLLIPVAD